MSVSSIIITVKASFQYRLGAFIFNSGVGRWHHSLHEFSMTRLQRSADAGHIKALLLIGQLLKYRGVSLKNKQAGVKYLHSAASKGLMDAQFMLAEALTDDALQLKTDNETQILALYEQAAQQGHIMAALRLKKAYINGLWGAQPDQQQADYWSEQFLKSSNR